MVVNKITVLEVITKTSLKYIVEDMLINTEEDLIEM